MMPNHMHMSVLVLSSVGVLPSGTVGAPGTQGAVVAGRHGIGASTPSAAAVAAATAGLAELCRDRKDQRGPATRVPPELTRASGSRSRLDGLRSRGTRAR